MLLRISLILKEVTFVCEDKLIVGGELSGHGLYESRGLELLCRVGGVGDGVGQGGVVVGW